MRFLTLIVAMTCNAAWAQEGAIDPTFTPEVGSNNLIYSTIVQPDGKIIIGGFYNSTPVNNIARLNSDGSIDVSFDPGTGANDVIYSTVIQPDGKIIIGGEFTNYNGAPHNSIVRLNANGSWDTDFNPGMGTGVGVGHTAHSITLQSDLKIIIAGEFTHYNLIPRKNIARLYTNGSIDTDFDPGTGANSIIYSTLLQPDGKIIIAGEFTNYDGTDRNYVARLNTDGSLDMSFNPGTGPNSEVVSTILQPDGKILIAGYFTSYDGTPKNKIARLNTDGTLDTSFDSGAGTGIVGGIHSVTLQPDGKIIVGGFFDTYNGTPRNNIARLYADGSLDMEFDPGSGANSGLYSTTLQPDGKIIIAGSFNSYNGTLRNGIARLNGSPVGLAELEQNVSLAFPNPTTGAFFVVPNRHTHMKEVVLRDSRGTVVQKRTLQGTSGPIAIDLASYGSGLYLIQITFADNTHTSGLVLKE